MDTVKQTVSRWYRSLDTLFTERDAWAFFKTVAVLETFGWVCLTVGILFKYNHWPYHDWAIGLGGSIHGIIVICYMLVVLFVHRALGWGLVQFTIAELINAVPYGVVAFERYASHQRKKALARAAAEN